MKLKKLILMGALSLGFAIGGAACSSETADTEYSVKFVADGKTIGTVNYTESNTDITAPGVPEKLHYIGAWEAYTLTSGDVVVNAVYTPKTYAVSWYDGETQVGTTQSWQYSETLATAPAVPEKEGKNGAWGEYVYDETNNTVKVSAVYTDKQYSVKFVADGETVATLNYTVSNKNIEEPDVPEKKHYNGVWEEYTLTSGDVVVNAVYTAKTYKIRFVAANGDLVSEVNYTVEDTSIDEPEVPVVEGYTGVWKDYALDGGDKEVEPEYTAIMCSVSYFSEDNSLIETVSVQWGRNAENKAITAQAGQIGVWVDSENEPYDFSQAVKSDLSLKAKLYATTVEVKKSLEMGVTTDEAYTFGENYGIKLVPSAWTTTFRFIESGLAEAAVYKFDAILGGIGDADLAIYYCEGSNWDSRVLLHTFTAANEKATLYLTKAQYQSLVADTADLEYCVKEYQGSVTAKMALYVSKVSVFIDKATIEATNGCTLGYDTAFTFGDEEYSSKLTGKGWTMDIKLCGDQMDATAYDYVVFQIYTTDFKCNCENQGHAGTQALRDLPETSYSDKSVALKDSVWTEIILKVADYNALISNQSRLRINNSCTAAGKEVWISQPKGVKSESWFTGGTQSVSVANSYNGKPTTSVKNSGWSVDLTVTTATEHTTGNMVFYIKTNNYAKGHDSDHGVKINNKWYSSAIVVGEWMKVTIPVSVWNDECVTGGKTIRINDSNNNANVIYYISEVVWEAEA